MAFSNREVATVLFVVLGLGSALLLDLSYASQVSPSHGAHRCSHGHDHDHDHHHHHHHEQSSVESNLLPEELAEEEDMKLYGFGSHGHHHDHDHEHVHFGVLQLTGPGLWLHALGCSFLVSMASLICLIILPVVFVKGKPSKTVVDSLALFGAGAMLGDAFLHQLPHAFGGAHSHSHDHHEDHDHDDHSGHSHAHSLADLSVGLSILAGIVLFLLVEKVVRYVEDNSGGTDTWGHTHHHHHKKSKKLKDDGSDDDIQSKSSTDNDKIALEKSSEVSDELLHDSLKEDAQNGSHIRKRRTTIDGENDKQDVDAAKLSSADVKTPKEEDAQAPSNLVFGYLNLFSDGVHNFTDGIALGSAFLLYGSVGGWSRTLFLLAHEIPQEVGDFGILVRSGFSVSKALFFNFLSALVALAGTALALLLGQDPGQSSLIEGFTAGGFIYIAVAGVLAEMNSSSKPTLKGIIGQLTSLILGMGVALCISLVE
ncbi:IAA-alanine resistance protein 1 [Humulus lupulus]|uniref:IAA-alanine resistance protein 1 n=1 Tax=Humulus lupulus TaxID=3486 RepID=UPI002B4091D5|nr:IAA-alanine resistance protein 1 [Humulus lupulus]